MRYYSTQRPVSPLRRVIFCAHINHRQHSEDKSRVQLWLMWAEC